MAALRTVRQLIAAGMTAAGAVANVTSNGRSDAGAAVPDTQPFAARFAEAVDVLDVGRAGRAAGAALSELGVIRAWTGLFAPHLQDAGARWERTRSGVEREHVASEAIHSALAEFARARNDSSRPCRVLAVATSLERHTLPLDALVAATAERGVQGCALGSLPTAAVHAAAATLRPSVVVLWAHSARTSDPDLLAGLHGRAPVVCSAGPGWESVGTAVVHLADLAGAVDIVSAWTA